MTGERVLNFFKVLAPTLVFGLSVVFAPEADSVVEDDLFKHFLFVNLPALRECNQ